MFLLSGVARYLFVPLAEAVVFANARVVHPIPDARSTLADVFVESKTARSRRFPEILSCGSSWRSSADSKAFGMLTTLCSRHLFTGGLFSSPPFPDCAAFFSSYHGSARIFPQHGQRSVHSSSARQSGTRIEETAKLCDLVEGSIRREIPEREVDNILDNIGLPYSAINFMHSTSGLIGAGDADILVSLKEDHHTTADYVQRLRETLPREYPGTTFYFLPWTSSLRC